MRPDGKSAACALQKQFAVADALLQCNDDGAWTGVCVCVCVCVCGEDDGDVGGAGDEQQNEYGDGGGGVRSNGSAKWMVAAEGEL